MIKFQSVKGTRTKNVFLFLIIPISFFFSVAKAAIPTKCFEIESILVDACGNSEGENEMFRFKIGPNPIINYNTDLTITWPSNLFLGLTLPNATTANIVSTLNSTIHSCGILIEPTGGILPAGKSVLLITSTAMNTSANSFTNLSDTLYVIFQNPGNTGGHFGNYSSTPGLRTLIMEQVSSGCADTATYDRSLLVNQSGTYGGSSAQNDGSTAQFSWPGNPTVTYINNGCQAPFATVTPNAGAVASTCAGNTVSLAGTVTGNYSSVIWQASSGTFSSATTLSTNYSTALSASGTIPITFGAITYCNDTVFNTVNLIITTLPSPVITVTGNTTVCQGTTVTLTASGANGGTYSWNTGQATAAIPVSTTGTYTVTATNSCGSQQATQAISVTPLPVITANSVSSCAGQAVILTANGGTTYSWNTGSTANPLSVTPVTTTTYTVTGTTAGCSSTAISIVTVTSPPVITVNSASICEGQSATLTANGGTTYSWSTGETINPINVTPATPSTYTVTGTTAGCSNTAISTVTVISIPTVSISSNVATGASPLTVNFTNNSSGATNYLWTFGDNDSSLQSSPSHTFQNAGTYPVLLLATNANGCTDTATIFITVIDDIPTKLVIPNVFTPNGDGNNDIFLANSFGIKNYECSIFDRWGLKMFETDNVHIGWDGKTTSGNSVSAGTYYYIIKATGIDQKNYDKKGFLLLTR
jgi:gliding motility-associated-like protein